MSIPSYYLLGKYIDPFVGVFAGVVAYYLWENHPRTAPPQGSHLVDLLKWKFADKRVEQAKPDWNRIKADLDQMQREVSGTDGASSKK
ncbi:hypothetical protein CALVIDRAFT_532233 [Calocera viscosa TUFC12733]|uniref:Non-classical export protein 1 n=1 Tax=Calocera viscosa (strain TUFC12733) TaxID=1330018 RepID=A0A167S0N2_CALVF|nr:hypothetical protein CALVIDRAFT_532233 [Calocera viscosa TUFC12733]